MGCLHKLLQPVLGTVIFVDGKGVVGIITPAIISFKFHDGHKINGVNTKSFQVIEGIDERRVIVFCGKIADQQFVDEQVGYLRGMKCGGIPGIGILCSLQKGGHSIGFSCRIGFQVGVGFGGDVLVVGIAHLVGIGVADVQCPVNKILENILLPGNKIPDLKPEPVSVGGFVHIASRIEGPAVEIAGYENIVFPGGI